MDIPTYPDCHHNLVLIDKRTRYPAEDPIESTSFQTYKEKRLKHTLITYGTPKRIESNGEPPFITTKFHKNNRPSIDQLTLFNFERGATTECNDQHFYARNETNIYSLDGSCAIAIGHRSTRARSTWREESEIGEIEANNFERN